MLVYEWKLPRLYKVNPQIAGEELERISEKNSLTPQNVVNESRSEEAILHNCFDWNDATAAESYRQVQAREIIRNLVTINISGEELKEPVRAFVSIKDDYKPMDIVVETADYQDAMLRNALSELKSFQRKYSGLSQLAEVFASIERVAKAS